jgi:hypothetical protein
LYKGFSPEGINALFIFKNLVDISIKQKYNAVENSTIGRVKYG